MKKLSLGNTEVLKRRRILLSIGGLLLLLIVWWFAWMSPEGTKLANANQQIQTKTQQLTELKSTLASSQHDAAIVKKDGKFLAQFASAVPPTPEAQVLTTQIFQLAARTVGSNHLESLTDNSTVPPATGQTLSEIPISLTINGPHNKCMAFLSGLYHLQRLVTVQGVTPTPQTTGSNVNVLANDAIPYTMSITATAYFSQPQQPTTAGATTG